MRKYEIKALQPFKPKTYEKIIKAESLEEALKIFSREYQNQSSCSFWISIQPKPPEVYSVVEVKEGKASE